MFGKVIGDFELLKLINRGGMAELFKARRRSDGEVFALRLMLEDIAPTPKSIRDFMHGCEIAAELEHPNIIKIIEIISDPERPYVVLEFVDGDNLKQAILKRDAFVMSHPLHILIEIAEGVNYLHSRNIIHRDIKPENIIISNGRPMVKIVDFGLSIQKKQEPVVTRSISGSPSYLAPEIILEKKYSETTDIYSMGVTAYELLTGRLPYEGRTEQEILEKHVDLTLQPRPIRDLNPTVSEKLERIVMKLLEKNPQQRYPDVSLFIRDFKAITIGAKNTPQSQ